MEVTHQAVADIIAEVFTSEPAVEADFVGFGLEEEYFSTEVIINLFATKPISDDQSSPQGVQIWFWFAHADKDRMNLSKFSFVEVLDLCHHLQSELDWGELVPVQIDEYTIQIALYRADDVCMEDVKLAHEHNIKSSVLKNMYRLCEEWSKLSPILSGVATGQIESVEGIEMLLCETAGEG